MAAEKELKLDPKYDDYDFPYISPTDLSGHPGHTTPEQDAQVVQLREALTKDGFTERLDTLTMVRLLPARPLRHRRSQGETAALPARAQVQHRQC